MRRGPGRDRARRASAGDDGPRSSRSSRRRRRRRPARRSSATIAGGGRRGLPGRRPLRARLRPARRRGDRAHPPAQGPRRRQALGGHVLLAAGDARAGRRARRRARRDGVGALLPGPGHPGRRQPRAPLPARLPRGPGAPRRAADRRAAGRARCCPIFQTCANRSGEPAPRGFEDDRPDAIVDGADLAIDGGELAGVPSTVVDLTGIDAGGAWQRPARGRAVRRPSWRARCW